MNIQWDIMQAWAEALRESGPLSAWCASAYGRAPQVLLGVNYAKPPGDDDAPFVAILPGPVESTADLSADEIRIRIVLAVYDERFDGGELAGLQALNSDFPALVMRAVSLAYPGAEITGLRSDFELADFPLLYRELHVTLTLARPITGAPRF